MSLESTINSDIKAAMLNKDKKTLEALRAVKAALLLEKSAKGINDGNIPKETEIKLLQKLVKQRKESAEIYTTQNRAELAETENFQALVIGKYLPEQMGEEEITKIIKEIITNTGATSIKEMGKVMGIASKQLAGKADNRSISVIVKNLLNT
ncbi:MAG: GatB/YqeY domain-containing protein [Bacteroidales bacterium]|nr:GatB/YqeY domain-containing protein [Bacteroidales bacterium]